MVKIKNITTRPFTLLLKGELRWGSHSILRELKHVEVKVELSDGSFGVSEAIPRPTIYGETAETIETIISKELLPRIRGLESQKYEDVTAALNQVKNNHTAKGAIDMALYEANARAQKKTLAQLIGATQEKVKVSYILGISSIATSLQEAQQVYEQGVRVFKIKIDNNFDSDVERVKELLAHLPDDVEYYADANETMTDANIGKRLAILKNMGFLYCEEPLPIQKINARKNIRSKHIIDIIGDDSCMNIEDLEREIEQNTIDILNIKVARSGYSTSLEMLKLAQGKINKFMVGSQAASWIGTKFAAIFAARPEINCPCELSFFLKIDDSKQNLKIKIQDGYLDIRQF